MDQHRRWNMGAPLWTWKKMSKHLEETYVIIQDQDIQKCAFYRQSDIDAILGL
jgi:hypothetical protein